MKIISSAVLLFFLASSFAFAQAPDEKDVRRSQEIFEAVRAKDQAKLGKLLKKKSYRAVINLTHEKNFTVLHLQASTPYASPVVTRMLLEAGANPHARDSRERTPLHYAAELGEPGTVRALLTAGADPEEWDEYGKNALDIAREAGRKDTFYLMRKQIIDKYSIRRILVHNVKQKLNAADWNKQPSLL